MPVVPEIWTGASNHRRPFLGDHGFRFEPLQPGEGPAVLLDEFWADFGTHPAAFERMAEAGYTPTQVAWIKVHLGQTGIPADNLPA